MKSKLSTILEACGMKAEPESTDIFDLIGKTCMITVKDKESKTSGNVYTTITNYSQVSEDIDLTDKKYAAVNKPVTLFLDMFEEDVFESLSEKTQEMIMETDEYKYAINKGVPRGVVKKVNASTGGENLEEIDLEAIDTDALSDKGVMPM